MDRRVKYTKQIIRQTLLELMQKKDINKITVTEICNLADVNRATFYKYYLDVYDLLEKIEDELLIEIKNTLLKENEDKSVKEKMRDVINTVKDNEDIFRVLLGENARKDFLLNILYFARTLCFEAWKNTFKNVEENDFNYLFTYTSNGVIAIIQLWVKNGCNETVDEITSLIYEIIKDGNSIFVK